VCNNKVITDNIGELVISTLLVLIAVHYKYELSYNSVCKPVLEFLQEKLIGDGLPSRKMNANYCNLFRAINCIEQKVKEQHDVNEEDTDEDATQGYCDTF